MSDWPKFAEPWPRTRVRFFNWLRAYLMDLQDRLEMQWQEFWHKKK